MNHKEAQRKKHKGHKDSSVTLSVKTLCTLWFKKSVRIFNQGNAKLFLVHCEIRFLSQHCQPFHRKSTTNLTNYRAGTGAHICV